MLESFHYNTITIADTRIYASTNSTFVFCRFLFRPSFWHHLFVFANCQNYKNDRWEEKKPGTELKNKKLSFQNWFVQVGTNCNLHSITCSLLCIKYESVRIVHKSIHYEWIRTSFSEKHEYIRMHTRFHQ